MNIAVLVKRVPDTEILPKIKPDNSGVSTDNINKFVINPYDEYAITQAVQVSKKHSGSKISIICVGPEKSKDVIIRALAMGGEEGILIKSDEENLDGITTAKLISEYIKDKGYDIIFAGKKSVDLEQGVVGPAVASLIDIPCACSASTFELSSDAKSVNISREVEEGMEFIEVALPAVITCEKGLNNPKPPPLPSILKAKKKPIEIVESAKHDINLKIAKVEEPPTRTDVKMIEGETKEQAAEIAKILKEEIKVL